MHIRTRMKGTILATVLCAALAAVTVNPMAFAQNRGTSGLPAGPGNPMASVQRQIDALTQQMAAMARLGQDIGTLQQQLEALQRQMSALSGLQQQIDTLNNQMAGLNNQMAGLNNQLIGLTAQVASLGTSGSLGVFDAAGKRMGDVVGVQDNSPWVSMEAAGHLFVLQVFPGQLIGQFVFFSSENCLGDAFVNSLVQNNGPNVFSIAAVSEPGGVVYAANAGGVPAPTSVRSVRQHDGSCFTFTQSVSRTVMPAAPVMILDSVFQRPYPVQ